MANIGLILLAAGQAQRMGEPKQLLKIRGEPMLHHVASVALASECSPIVVVTGANAELVSATIADLPVSISHNPNWILGVGSSIQCGMQALLTLELDGVIIALADQPLLTANTFNRLVASYQHARLPITASEYAHTLGTPALFDHSVFSSLLELPVYKGCKELIMSYPGHLLSRCPCPEAEIDIDTPSDYLLLQRADAKSRHAKLL